jgi:predicted metalloendopeptidase
MGLSGRRRPSARENYYRFVNEAWLKETPIPEDASSTNISRQIAEKIEKQLISIVKEKLVHEPQSSLSKFVRSIYYTWDSPRQTEFAIVELVGALKNMNSKEDVGFMIGKLNRLQARSPLILKVTTDTYDTNYYRLQISEYSPCVPHKNFLIDEKYSKDRKEYKKFVGEIGKYFGVDDLSDFVDIEMDVAHHLPSPIEEDDTPNRYNLLTFDEVMAKYQDIPWNSILNGLGTSQEHIEKHSVIVTNSKYLEYVNKYFTGDLDAIRKWLLGSAIITFGRFISGEIYQKYFNFFGKTLKGATEMSDVDRIMMAILTTHMPQLLSREYAERYVSPKVKENAIEIVHVLKKAAIRRMQEARWMSAETKVKAIDKMNKMGFKIAYPSVWRDESRGIDFSETQLLKNLFRVNEQDTQWGLDDIGPRERGKWQHWDSPTYEVNAFYYPDYNELVIPAGILQSPFYDSHRSMAWNLGGIGNVITHEMTHGFDSDGRNHDAEGNYAPWWKPEENEEYEKKSKQICELFSVKYMGAQIDGKLTLMENIADLGGMSIALEALRTIMLDKTQAEKKRMLHDFFSSYAVSWRNKDRKKSAELASRADKHAPAQLRVNKIISQFPEFYETYGVKPGDALWVDPNKRVTLW